MISILLILFYITSLSFITYKSDFYKLKNFNKSKIAVLLNIKFLAAFIYLYISKHHISGGDIFQYYNDSLIIFDEIKAGNFINYIQLTFGFNNVSITENIALAVQKMGFWFDTPSYLMVRLNSLFNLLSFGSSIYVNALFFAFISFNACIILAKTFQELFNLERPWTSYFIFLTPSLLYWTSGMHKESVSVLLISLLLYSFIKTTNKISYWYIFIFLISSFLLIYTRVFILILFIPAFLTFYIWKFRQSIRPILISVFVLISTLTIGYVAPQILNKANFVDVVIQKKNLYEALGNGNTVISLGEYQQSYWGLFIKTPQALFNSLVRPHFLDIHSFFLFLASIESLLITISFITSLFYIKNLQREHRALILSFLMFSISYLILTGLIVPNIGAILRYRSVAFFILIPSILILLSKKEDVL